MALQGGVVGRELFSGAALRGRLVVSGLLGSAVLLALLAFADFAQLLATVQRFAWPLLFPIIGLTLINYGIRFVKWEYFLRQVGIFDLPRKDSLGIFLAGFTMVMTPGKVGEFLKAYFVRRVHGASFARAAPVVLAERLTDGLAMVLLTLVGLASYPPLRGAILGVGAALLALVALVQVRPAAQRLLGWMHRLPLLSVLAPRLEETYESTRLLLAPSVLALSVALGLVAWGCEGVAYFLVLVGLGEVPGPALLSQAVFILAASTILGAVSLLPGGLGITDGSLVGLALWIVGLDRAAAVAGALLIRLATLWFGMALGVGALLALRRRLFLGPGPGAPGEERA
ncbi:MAG: lysylphosphatidylglycerol synthase transmembrane domain-containing protein [Anaerolineae bacterium]